MAGKFEKISIQEMVEGINKKYLLPTIQRKFVWESEKIENLFDSLMMDFPFGTLLFWQLTPKSENEFNFYKFVKDYNETNTTRETGNFVDDYNDADKTHYAVLDGQQRLTAFYIGLVGSYAVEIKKRGGRPKTGWECPPKKLYLNLLSKNDSDDDDDDSIRISKTYDFRFLTDKEVEENKEKSHWFTVGKIMEKDFSPVHYLMNAGLDYAQDGEPYKMLAKLQTVITSREDAPIRFYCEKDQNLDKVLNIFIRTNDGGKPLNPSDLLMSYAAAQLNKVDKDNQSESFDIEQKLDEVVNTVNNIGKNKNFSIDRDFILKTLLILCNDESKNDSVIKVSTNNFKSETMKNIYDNRDHYFSAIESAVKLVNEFGFNQSNFASNNSLIPIAHYISRKTKNCSTEDFILSDEDKGRIIFWFIYVNLGKIWKQHTKEKLAKYRKTLLESDTKNFPLENMLKIGKTSSIIGESLSEQLINLIMGTSYSDSKFCRMALTILYWKSGLDLINTDLDVDHIFAKNLFKNIGKYDTHGVNPEEELDVNAMTNLQFLTAKENKEKSDKFLDDWMEKKEKFYDKFDKKKYVEISCIPEDTENPEDKKLHFPNKEFFEEREKMMRTRLEKNLKSKNII